MESVGCGGGGKRVIDPRSERVGIFSRRALVIIHGRQRSRIERGLKTLLSFHLLVTKSR